MRGKIVFRVASVEEIVIECNLKEVDWLGKLCLFDSLMRCFDLDPADRLIISRMIALGGIDQVDGLGAETEVVKVDKNAVAEAIKRIDDHLA